MSDSWRQQHSIMIGSEIEQIENILFFALSEFYVLGQFALAPPEPGLGYKSIYHHGFFTRLRQASQPMVNNRYSPKPV